jgi:uracil-DNA glycosylase
VGGQHENGRHKPRELLHVRLRDLLRKEFAGWQEDLSADWRKVVGETELNFSNRAFDREWHPGEIIVPGRKDQPLSGAPSGAHIFRAFEGLKPDHVRAVILGQDPYPNPAWATGRAFEQGNLTEWPANRGSIADSLRRIVQVLANARTGNTAYVAGESGWKQLVRDVKHGNVQLEHPRDLFERLQKGQGVLLLNTSLTVSVNTSSGRPRRVGGHFRLWEPVLYRLLSFIATRQQPHAVFLLWGHHAFDIIERGGIRAAAERADTWKSKVDVVRHVHPAAITREGAVFLLPPNPFRSANDGLERMGAKPINW